MRIKRGLDKLDALVAAALAVGLAVWGFVWSHPYPHPQLWPFLGMVRNYVSLGVLSALGKIALGAFAAIAYLILRAAWVHKRDAEDDKPDRFMLTRAVPICAAVACACLPATWRAAQFLTPGFAFLVMVAFAFFLWLCGRGYRRLTAYTFSFLILGLVGAVAPLALAPLVFAFVTDFLARWRTSIESRRKEDEDEEEDGEHDARSEKDNDLVLKGSMELTLSVMAALFGFALAVPAGIVYFAGEIPTGNLPDMLLGWWNGWLGALSKSLSALPTYLILFAAAASAIALAVGRRLRAAGSACRPFAMTASGLFALFALALVCRSVDKPERTRLALIRDFVAGEAEDVKGVEWFFTDGRFDDILRFEFAQRGIQVKMLDALNPPSSKKAKKLRDMAPEIGDRELFTAGGAEVFRSWAKERPDRLKTAAWQIGSGVVRRHEQLEQRPCGAVIRAVETTPAAFCDAADQLFAQFARTLVNVVGTPLPLGSVFGGVDKTVAAKFDAVLWRAARMASERTDRLAEAGQTAAAREERDVTIQLDGHNGTLRAQGATLEKLLPTANLVLTSREALDVSLRRADFDLAQRYAREVLTVSPHDAPANFAMGMASLESGNFFAATRHFEEVLKVTPKDSATLNNMALAYYKLGKTDLARECLDKAEKLNPNAPQIRKNRERIFKSAKPAPSK